MIGGIASRYAGGRFVNFSGSAAGFSLSPIGVTTPAALGYSRTTSPFPGWTIFTNTFADDTYTTVNLPFSVQLSGPSTFSTIYPTSNQYVMLGSFTTVQWVSFSASSPNVPKLMLNPGDTSWYSVYVKSTLAAVTVRIQGGYSSNGLGDNIIEITFFNAAQFSPSMQNYTSAIQVVTGSYTAPSSIFVEQGLYNSSSSLTPFGTTMAPSKNYLYLLSSDGYWEIQPDRYLKNEAAYAAGNYAYT
jgi:hypothetical protein